MATSSSNSNSLMLMLDGNTNPNVPSIWAARTVEWPIPSFLSVATYQRLWQQSQQLGQEYGLSYAPLPPGTNNAGGGGDAASTFSEATGSNAGGSTDDSTYYGFTGFMSRVLNSGDPRSGASTASSSGLASVSGEPTSVATGGLAGSNMAQQRPVRPPRKHCVAASHGWIVAALEAPPRLRLVSRWNVRRGTRLGGTTSTSGTASTGGGLMGSHSHLSSGGSGVGGGLYDHPHHSAAGSPHPHDTSLYVLPPPAKPASATAGPNACRIVHVFCDPTASHTVLSAANGELYYLHSTTGSSHPSALGSSLSPTSASAMQGSSGSSAGLLPSGSTRIRKLPGFGPSAVAPSTGTPTDKTHITGLTATQLLHHHHNHTSGAVTPSSSSRRGRTSSSTAADHSKHFHHHNHHWTVQTGLTPGTYVTAIAWDVQAGTEATSSTVLLGTSGGEIYEYVFEGAISTAWGGSADGSKAATASSQLTTPLPILLHKLDAPISGLYLERNHHHHHHMASSVGGATSGGGSSRHWRLVLAATSGRDQPTRLYSFATTHALHQNYNLSQIASSTLATSSSTSSSPSPQLPPLTSYWAGVLQTTPQAIELPNVATVPPPTNAGNHISHQHTVDFCPLVVVNDAVALKTAVGIYHGKIDRSLAALAASSATAGVNQPVLVQTGMIPYPTSVETRTEKSNGSLAKSSNRNRWGANGTSQPLGQVLSLALTPHHFIALHESCQVSFINRVSQKVIQHEQLLDETLGGGNVEGTNSAALLMDIRRPDQVWLRQGRSLVHISSSQEDRDVWKYTLQRCLQTTLPPPVSLHGNRGSIGGNSGSAAITGAMLSSASAALEEEKLLESQFERAKALCSNAAQKAVVTAARAEYFLQHGRAETAAKYLALLSSSLSPFPDTAVRLALPKLGIRDEKNHVHGTVGNYGASPSTANAQSALAASNLPLITYLAEKLRVGKLHHDRMTCTMIGAWLTELYLHERNEKRAEARFLSQFLNSHVNSMDAPTIMKILASHDVSAHECALYAASSGDLATAVQAALGIDDTTATYQALTILNEAPLERAQGLYYKHAGTFLARAPTATVDALLQRYPHGLNPQRLLPALMHYEQARANRVRARQSAQDQQVKSMAGEAVAEPFQHRSSKVSSAEGVELRIQRNSATHASTGGSSFVEDPQAVIRYLEGIIQQGCRMSAIFSYLISLYAKLADEDPLLKFLTEHVPASATYQSATQRALLGDPRLAMEKAGGDSGPLDMSYALRTVLASGRHYRSAIKLYMGFGMRQQAVELALKVDPSLARELAQESVELEERKRLWLMIAKHAAAAASSDRGNVGGDNVVSRVVSVLRDCGPDVLSIEDVLPFLPDFAQIDQIKDEICEALTSYSTRIEGFLRDMSDCDRTCDELRQEIGRLKSQPRNLDVHARCALTHRKILQAGEPFYVFPSGYVILAGALRHHVWPHLNDRQRARVQELEQLIKKQQADHDVLQVELDGLIAAECPLTGSIMIESIDQSFDLDWSNDTFSIYPESSRRDDIDIERAEV